MTHPTDTICLVTALGAEAAPLIRHFRLRPIPLQMASAYAGERCRLLQTGLGKLAAAVAIGAFLEAYPDTRAIINVGLCGADAPVGSVFLVHSVSDAATGRRWYPHLTIDRHRTGFDSRALLTLDAPADDYRHDCLFDMEASSIAGAALRLLDTSRVQFIKCVSDNPAQPADAPDARQARTLMALTIPLIEQLMQSLDRRPAPGLPNATAAAIARLGERLMQQIPHSVTESHALQRLLIRYHALAGRLPDVDEFAACHRAADLHRRLQDRLAVTDLHY